MIVQPQTASGEPAASGRETPRGGNSRHWSPGQGRRVERTRRTRHRNGSPAMSQPSAVSDPLWYKDAVIYELPVKSFCDGNADGVGDFTGLTAKLDYLQTLG